MAIGVTSDDIRRAEERAKELIKRETRPLREKVDRLEKELAQRRLLNREVADSADQPVAAQPIPVVGPIVPPTTHTEPAAGVAPVPTRFALDTKGAGLDEGTFGFGEAGDRTGFDQGPFAIGASAIGAAPVAGGTISLPPLKNESTLFPPTVTPVQPISYDPLRDKCSSLLALALSLERMARAEIDKLHDEHPNHPGSVESYRRRIDLLTILADGLSHIAAALNALAEEPDQPILLGKTREIVDALAKQIQAWWETNGQEAVDWMMRIPVMSASIAMLDLAGAYMPTATAAIVALAGGEKALKMLQRKKIRRGKSRK